MDVGTVDNADFGKDSTGNNGNKFWQRIFLEIVVKGIWKASLKLQ